MLQSIRINFFAIAIACFMLVVPGAAAQEISAQQSFFRGSAALAVRDFDAAESFFKLSVEQLRQAPASERWRAAYPLAALANLRLEQSREREAMDFAIASEKASLSAPFPHPESRLLGLNVRATVLSRWLDPKADAVWEEAAEISRNLDQPEDPESVYSTLNNYAEYLKETGRAGEAVELHAFVLRARQLLPQSHPAAERFLATSRLNLAVAHFANGDDRQAELELKQILSDIAPSESADLGVVYGIASSNLAQILIRQKKLREARGFALDGLRRFRSPAEPGRLIAANSLAMILALDEQDEESRAIFEEIYRARLVMAWDNQPDQPRIGLEAEGFSATGLANEDLLIAAENLAYSNMVSGRTEEAIPLFDGLVQVMSHLTGADSAVTARALGNAGQARIANGQFADGIAQLERAYDLIGADSRLEDFRMIVGYNLGVALLEAGQAERAVSLIEPYSQALMAYSERIDVLSSDQLRFERFSRNAHEKLLDAAWMAEQAR